LSPSLWCAICCPQSRCFSVPVSWLSFAVI
jgi:hypothetical protein